MSRFDVSDFDADELNQGIDDTNFPNSRHASCSNASTSETHKNNDDDGPKRNKSLPMAVKPNGFAKSFDDEVFEVPGTPKTPRSLPTPGNCECKVFFFLNFFLWRWKQKTTSAHRAIKTSNTCHISLSNFLILTITNKHNRNNDDDVFWLGDSSAWAIKI
jgi:hypothetical protein